MIAAQGCQVGELSARNFGLMIAYLIPGFVALCGVAALSAPVRGWLDGPTEPTIGGFLYVVLGSLAAGMTVNAVRWAVVDTILHATGLCRPVWDDSKLAEKLTAFEFLVDNYYRHYLFYANTLVAIGFAYLTWRFAAPTGLSGLVWVDFGVFLIVLVFVAGSRDTLKKYYQRATLLLGSTESEVGDDKRRRASDKKGIANDAREGK